MAIVVEERYKGRRLDSGSAEVVYLVTGTGGDAGSVTDEDAYTAVVDSAPEDWYGLPAANVDVREELVQGTVWEVAAIYSATDPVIYQQSRVTYEFSFQAPQEKVYLSLQTKGAYSRNGPVHPGIFGNAINVVNDNGELRVEGLDLPAGTPTNTWIYEPIGATVTDAYQHEVEKIMGAVNSTMFKNRAAGTMRLVSCDGGATFTFGTIPKWVIRFGFQFRANRQNFLAGGIEVRYKGGHDLLWGYYEDSMRLASGEPEQEEYTTEPEDDGLVKRPKFLLVEQVFPEVNLNLLGI